MPTRKEVYAVIDGERTYQDSLRTQGRFSEDVLPVPGEIVCIEYYLDKLKAEYANNPGEAPEECQHIFRKIAGMCVRAMENHGAPKRVIPTRKAYRGSGPLPQ